MLKVEKIIEKIIEEVVSGNTMKIKEYKSQNFKDHRSRKTHKRKRNIERHEVPKKRLCENDIRFGESSETAKMNGKVSNDMCDKGLWNTSIEKKSENTIDMNVATVINEEINRRLQRSIPKPCYVEADELDASFVNWKKSKRSKDDKAKRKKQKRSKREREKQHRNRHSRGAGNCDIPKFSIDEHKLVEKESSSTFHLSPKLQIEYKPPPSPVLVLSNETEEILKNTSLSYSANEPFVQCKKLDFENDIQSSESSSLIESDRMTRSEMVEDLSKASDVITRARILNNQTLPETKPEENSANILNVFLEVPVGSNSSNVTNDVLDMYPKVQDGSLKIDNKSVSSSIESHKRKSNAKVKSISDINNRKKRSKSRCNDPPYSELKKNKKGKKREKGKSAATKKIEECNNSPSRLLEENLTETLNSCKPLENASSAQSWVIENHTESEESRSGTSALGNIFGKPDVFQCRTTNESMRDATEVSDHLPKPDQLQGTAVEIESNLKISSLKTIEEWDNDSLLEPPSPVTLGNLYNIDVKQEVEPSPVVILADVLPILNPTQRLQLCQSTKSLNDPQNPSYPCGTCVSNDISRCESVTESVIKTASGSIESSPKRHTTSPVPEKKKEDELDKRVFRLRPIVKEQKTQHFTKSYKHIAIKQLYNYTEIVIVVESLKNKQKNERSLPKEYNYLNIHALKELLRAFLHCKKDENCKAVLLSSVGPIFCSGICPLSLLQWHTEENKSYDVLATLRKLVRLLINFTKPLVAAVQGPAVDFGASLLLFCDSVFASEKANFHWSSAMQSVSPYGCVSTLLPQVVGKIQASTLMMGSKMLTATEAQSCGLVTEVFPHDILANSVIPRCLYLSSTLGNGILSTKELLVNQKKKNLLATNDIEMNLLTQCLKRESNRMIIENYIATKILTI